MFMQKQRRTIFILAIVIEIAALILFLSKESSVLNFLLVTGAMVCLQISLLWDSNFQLWKKE